MLLSILAIVAGLAALVWTADRFVVGASAIAANLGVSPIVIGLTIVGFGTSAPEMFVAGIAAWQGAPAMGIGNAVGSNIANIALVLGFTALISPLDVRSETLRREFPVLMVTTLVALGLSLDGRLGRIDGIILFSFMGLILYWMVSLGLRTRSTDPMQMEYAAEMPERMSMLKAVGWFLIGLAGLLISSRILVWGAVDIAKTFGVSDLVIGLTIIAVGTSLPELAASAMSAWKKEYDIAIGNIIGSNMFNILVVLAIPGMIEPDALPPDLITRDFPVMIGLTVLLFVFSYGIRRPGRLSRFDGGLLFGAFLAYQGLLYIDALK